MLVVAKLDSPNYDHKSCWLDQKMTEKSFASTISHVLLLTSKLTASIIPSDAICNELCLVL